MNIKNAILALPTGLAVIDDVYYETPPHINLIEDKLLDVVNGRCKRLIISMPPRHGKSFLVSKYFPAWILMKKKIRLLLASYEAEFAASWGRKVRDLINEFGADFNIKLSSDMKASHRFELSNGSEVATFGVGGAITGRGADLLIIDDPVKNAEASLSVTQRNNLWQWFISTAYTRLEPDGACIIIMTRWHYDDLVGRLIKQMNDGGERWEVLNIPAIAETNDILGRAEGEPLWNERYNLDSLAIIKKTLGIYWFSAQYQQKPIAGEYQIFKEDYWSFYSHLNESDIIFKATFWDTAFKQGEANDYTVGLTVAATQNGFYVLNMFRGKPTFSQLKAAVIREYEAMKPDRVLIEDAASGQSLLQELKDTRLPIKAIGTENKEIKAHRVSAQFENRNVYLREGAQYNGDIISELAVFPNGSHDDIVDCFTGAIDFLRKHQKRKPGEGYASQSFLKATDNYIFS